MNADIIVIGSGVAGAALVSKLLNANPSASVLMLEAGGKIKMRDFGLFQNYLITNKLPNDSKVIYDSSFDLSYPDRDKPGENVCTGDTQIPLNGARSIAYGGSTTHWGGWAFRLKPEDFQLHTNLEKKGIANPQVIDWPITYDDLEPYYCEAEHYIGVSGDSRDSVVPRKKGYPYKHFPHTLEDGLFIDAFEKMEPPIGYSHMPIARYGLSDTPSNHAPCQTTGLCKYCPFGARFVAANYLDDLKSYGDYPNFTILQNSVVDEILMDTRTRASGVRFFNAKNNRYETLKADTIVIASGAIEAPKLLQRSGTRYWKSGIGNDNDLVGRYLISHPYFFYKAKKPKNEQMLQPQMGFPTLVSRHFDSEEEQVKGKFILVHPSTSPVIKLAQTMGEGKSSDDIKKLVSGPIYVQLQGMIEVLSDWDNRVLNSDKDKRNRFGMIQTIIHHSKAPSFDARMNDIGKIVASIFDKMGAKDTAIDIPVSWRADHAACTTRMSDDPQKGVVDRNLKVHGVENLYVCSNASFSSLGAVNPTLTLTALSLRLGDHLITNKR